MAGLGLLLTAVTLASLSRTAHVDLRGSDMLHEHGHAFSVNLKQQFGSIWRAVGDNARDGRRSDLQLFEDGRPAGPPHAAFDDVRDIGAGRYLHWGRSLYFSASDNTDPRSNGRRYTLTTELRIPRDRLIAAANSGLWLVALGLATSVRIRGQWHTVGATARRLHDRSPEIGIAAAIPTLLVIAQLALMPELWNGSDNG